MSSIDERVVQMKFDNSQFQKGVSDTNRSLDDLKRGLNLDQASKSLESLDAAGKRFSLAGVATGVDAIASKFSALSIIGIAALGSIAAKAVDVGLGFAKDVIGGLLDPLIEGGKKRSLAIEQAKFMFEGLGMDVEATMNSAKKAVLGTAYGLDAAASAAAQFGASGMRAGDDMTSALRGIAGVAAMTGSSYDDVANIFTKVAGQGRLMGDDLLSLSSRGINAASTLAKSMGITEDKVRDMVTKGKIDFATFYKAMDGAFGEHATAANETYTGSLSNLKAALSRIGADYYTARFSALKDIFNALSPVVDNLHKAFQPLIDAMNQAMGISSAGLVKQLKAINLDGITKAMPIAVAAIKNVVDGLLAIVRPIGDAFKQIFPPVTAEQMVKIATAIKDITDKFKIGAKTADEIKRTFAGFFAIFDIGLQVIKGAIGMLAKLFTEQTKGAGGILDFTAKIGDWLVNLDKAIKKGDDLKKFFSGLHDVITNIINVFRTIIGFIAAFVVSLSHFDASGFTGVLDRMGGHLDAFKKAWKDILDFNAKLGPSFQKVGEFFEPMAKKIGSFFSSIGHAIAESVRTMDFKPILDVINTGMLVGIATLVTKFFKNGMKIDIGGGIMDKIKEAFGGLTDTMSAMQEKLKAETLMKIAGAIALLTLSVVALSMIDSVKLASALAGLAVMFTELMGSMAILEKITSSKGYVKMPVLTTALILLAVAIDLLVIAVVALSKLDWNELAKGLTGVAVLLGSLAGAMQLMPEQGKMISTGIGLVLIGAAVKILASAVKDLSGLKWEEVAKGLAGVVVILGSLVGTMQLMPEQGKMISTGIGLVLIGAALKVMASAIKDLSGLSWEEMAKGLSSVAGALGIIAGAMHLMPKNMMEKSAAMILLAAALKIIASAMKDMGGMSWEEIAKSMLVLGGSLIVLASALGMMDKTALLGAAALLVAAVALNVLVPVLKQMGDMSWDQIMKAAIVLAGALLIIAGGMYLMSGALLGAAALIVVAGALAILTPVLLALGSMSWDDIGRGLTMLAGALAVIGIAGALLTPTIPTLLGLGAALLLLGAGVALAGIGLLAFSVGLTALSVSGAAGTAALVAMVAALLGLIPMAFEQIGLGIVAFAKVLADNVPTFLAAMVTLITALLTAIDLIAPKIVQTLVNLLWLLVTTIENNLPKFIDAGFNILVGFLNGIGNNIGRVIDAAVNIIVNFINGIANNLQKILDAGANLIIKFIEGIGSNALKITNAAADTIVTFVNGLADSIKNHSQALRDAGGNLAFAIIDGMTGGLASKVKDVAASAWDMGKKAIGAIKQAIDSNSPSKETYKLGSYFGDGFALGITTLTTGVEKAATNMGNTAVSAIKDSISNVASMASAEIDMTPTIRPVLDLSAIKKDSGLISGMITPPSLAIDGTYAKASSLAEATRNNPDIVASSDNTTASSNDKLTLIQNNYSPKALSSAEIYRNTKNQLSVAKGVLAP